MQAVQGSYVGHPGTQYYSPGVALPGQVLTHTWPSSPMQPAGGVGVQRTTPSSVIVRTTAGTGAPIKGTTSFNEVDRSSVSSLPSISESSEMASTAASRPQQEMWGQMGDINALAAHLMIMTQNALSGQDDEIPGPDRLWSQGQVLEGGAPHSFDSSSPVAGDLYQENQELKTQVAENVNTLRLALALCEQLSQQVAELQDQLAKERWLRTQQEAALGSPVGKDAALLGPFHAGSCSSTVTLSEDGYVATRSRGAREAYVIGSSPLPRKDLGWYFELEIIDSDPGPSSGGGLGIGFTRSNPSLLGRAPEKATGLPDTVVLGYWGRLFSFGKEAPHSWCAGNLPAGSRVGLLISEQDLQVFVNGQLAGQLSGAFAPALPPDALLFPVVDVFAATKAVRLLLKAEPPGPTDLSKTMPTWT